MTISQEEYLEHYGVKGMKWGVRRYEKYDGTYTQRGVKRFREAEKNYDTAQAKYKATKGEDPQARKILKGDVKRTKRAMDKAYERLKRDKLADEGKKLYRSGKTITDNSYKAATAQAAIVMGGNVVGSLLAKYGGTKVGSRAGAAITIGGTAVNIGINAKMRRDNKRLRAYYAHSEDLTDSLQHYGVKGMRWGVRKEENRDRVRRAGKAIMDTRERAIGGLRTAGRNLKNVGSSAKKVKAIKAERKAKETAKRSPERREVDKIRKKGKAKYMTDAELKTAINRLNLETQYNRLSLEVYSPGKKFTKDFLTRSGNKSADAVVQQYAIKKIRGG